IKGLSTEMYRGAIAIAGVLAACGQSPVTHYEPAPRAKPAPPPADAGIVWTPTPKLIPLVVPKVEAKPASWLEAPDPAARVDDKLAPREPHSLGSKAAVVRAGDQLVVIDKDRGVISI